MTLQQYLASCTSEERRQLWGDSRSRRAYIYNLSKSLTRGHSRDYDRRPSPEMAMELERLTQGKVSRAELRPDLWA
jgi:hypothetical protein